MSYLFEGKIHCGFELKRWNKPITYSNFTGNILFRKIKSFGILRKRQNNITEKIERKPHFLVD